MDPVTPIVWTFLANHSAYIFGAMAVATVLEAFVDSVVRPWVAETASKRDDEILEKYVDPPLRFVSRALSFFSARMGRK